MKKTPKPSPRAKCGYYVHAGLIRKTSWLEIFEFLVVTGGLILDGIAIPLHLLGPKYAAAAATAKWAYVLCFLLVPALFENRASFHRLLKLHRAFVYALSWIFSALVVRSIAMNLTSRRQSIFEVLDLCLTSLLLLLSMLSKNKASTIRSHGDSPSPEPTASLFSLATFTWLDPIIWQGYRKTFELSDVWDLAPGDTAVEILAKSRRSQKSSRLAVHLLIQYSGKIFLQGLWAICAALFTFVPTILLRLLLEYLEDPTKSSVSAAWLYVVLILLSGFLKATAEGQASWLGKKISIHLRAIIVSEIFSKSLRRKAITSSSKQTSSDDSDKRKAESGQVISAETGEEKEATTGKITNLMAVDSAKIVNVTSFLHLLWASVPAELIIGITLLYEILGYASIAGLAIMIVLIPIKIFIARGFSKIQAKIMSTTDARIQTTSDLLQSIRIIKYFAYEDHVAFNVQEKRALELKALRLRFTLWTLTVTLYNTTPVLITFFSFLIYTVVDHRSLKPSVAFPALSLFALLRIPLDKLASTLASVQEAMVSIKRVEQYLEESETDKYRQYYMNNSYHDFSRIGAQSASFSWDAADAKAFALVGVGLQVLPNTLNVIAGSTGSGKTSLLLALIGEMDYIGGKIHYAGKIDSQACGPDSGGHAGGVAYCAQRSWLINDTIQGNILFGEPWDSDRYSAVIESCGLRTDLRTLPAGDDTLVGEKGIKLSGGQKQRAALARAIYSRARVVLLDDCLSAVDSRTAEWIMSQCITGKLMHDRTCLLVTHNTALTLRHAKHIAVLGKGKVVIQGSPDRLESSNSLPSEIPSDESSKDLDKPLGTQQFSVETVPADDEDGQATLEIVGQIDDGDDSRLLEEEYPDLAYKTELPKTEAKAIGCN